MKETQFIDQNKERWIEIEELISSDHKDPDKLNAAFIQVTNDLSYARTFYPNRSVRVYLNNLSRSFPGDILRTDKKNKNWFVSFWLEEYPQVVIACKKQLLLSLCIFVFAIAVGVFSSRHDPEFPAYVLGPDYIETTQKNIRNGDPMGIYKSSDATGMFLRITLNNIYVAFIGFMLGLFVALGSVAFLIINGIMLGTFQYFFISQGLFGASASVIWLHGTIEISSIIVACAAGIKMGSGLLLPGTYNRLQSFQTSAALGIKLLAGTIPLFIFAAFIESFITRFTEMPLAIRIFLILVSLVLILTLFVVYPLLKSRRGFTRPLKQVKLEPERELGKLTGRIISNDEITGNAFQVYRQRIAAVIPYAVAGGFLLGLAQRLLNPEETLQRAVSNSFFNTVIRDSFRIFHIGSFDVALITTTVLAALCMIVFRIFSAYAGLPAPAGMLRNTAVFLQIALLLFPGIACVWLGYTMLSFFVILLYLFVFIIAYATYLNGDLIRGFRQGWRVVIHSSGSYTALQLLLLLFTFVFVMILNSPVVGFYMYIINWLGAPDSLLVEYIAPVLSYSVVFWVFNLVIVYSMISACMFYHSAYEASYAEALKERIARVGTHRVKRGLEYEK